MNETIKSEFWTRVSKEPSCWRWIGNIISGGYGRMKIDGKHYYAHRTSYEMHIGTIARGLVVCHTCDNRWCVNPAHLWLGTHADNQSDCYRKGRRAKGKNNGRNTKPESTRRGTSHGRSKLTEADVRKIRKLAGTMSQQKIGDLIGTPQTNVSLILRRKAWAHVK
jgi:hypothetical protein